MKKLLKSSLFSTAFVFLFVSCSDESPFIDETSVDYYQIDLTLSQLTDWEMAEEMLTLVNQYRASKNLSELVIDYQHASAYAVEHTKYMIAENAISHDHLSDRTAGLINIGASFVGENVAQGYSTADDVVAGWIGSSLHREILEGNYTHAGFGVLQNSSGTYFFTMILYL